MDREYMLTTTDNPFDPFEDFTSWFLFDCEKGYYTCNKIARLAKVSDEMSQKEINDEYNKAIDKLISMDFLGIYERKEFQKTEDQETESNA